jgi:hypothetical protein
LRSSWALSCRRPSSSTTLMYVCSTIYVSSYYYICVLILLYMCPHTTIYVSSYSLLCTEFLGFIVQQTFKLNFFNVRILVLLYMCPHTAIHVSLTCYVRVLILLYICPHTEFLGFITQTTLKLNYFTYFTVRLLHRRISNAVAQFFFFFALQGSRGLALKLNYFTYFTARLLYCTFTARASQQPLRSAAATRASAVGCYQAQQRLE